MGMMASVMRKFGYAPVRKRSSQLGGYGGADVGRLFSSWMANQNTEDANLRQSLKLMRARSREMCRNNPYAKRFLRLVVKNVVGSHGITLQSKVRDPNGSYDSYANKVVEAAWGRWSQERNASVCGQLSFVELQQLFMRHVAQDGECLVRIVRGYDNPFKFSLQILEPDHLDETLMDAVAQNGNDIRMGIEVDKWQKPVAYYIRTTHPGDFSFRYGSNSYERIPASEMIHGYVKDRSSQSRGVPWLHPVMAGLKMLDGYQEAELVAARMGASTMGYIKRPITEDGYTGEDAKDSIGNPITDFEPGAIESLAPGEEMGLLDPTHPNGNYGNFCNTILRAIASGLDVSHHSLTGDLSGVNYSTARVGLLDERDGYRVIQRWMIERFCKPIFEAWLEMALLTQQIPLPMAKYEKYNTPQWQPRGFDWVDPLKDQQANVEALTAGLTTRGEVLAEQGRDIEDVFSTLAEEKKLAEFYGLSFDLKRPAPYQEPQPPATEGASKNATA